MIRARAPLSPALGRLGQLAITALLVALLWRAADGPEILRNLGAANPGWLCAAIAALLCQTVLSAWRWKITAAALGQTLPLPRAVREYFISSAVNQALPGGVMGDAARAVRARSEVGLALSGLAVGLERLAGQIAMFAALTIGFALTYLWQGGLDWLPRHAAPLGLTIAAVLAAGICAAVLQKPLKRFSPTAAHWAGLARNALFSRQALPAQVGLGIAITLCNLAAFGLCAKSIDLPLSAGALFTLVPLILFSMLIPLTISGWGVREGSAALLLPLAGATPTQAVAASVLFGLAMLLAVIPGLLILVRK